MSIKEKIQARNEEYGKKQRAKAEKQKVSELGEQNLISVPDTKSFETANLVALQLVQYQQAKELFDYQMSVIKQKVWSNPALKNDTLRKANIELNPAVAQLRKEFNVTKIETMRILILNGIPLHILDPQNWNH